ncbi:transmembrane protein 71 [Erpetoichthys calabaricus]|nr:transmembrane protein 71 [Erpetoichthys calabaricus]
MAAFFSTVATSSPLKMKEHSEDQPLNRSLPLLSDECSYECYSVNPLTGSPCMCRRSPRLLSNGYYILTEDSFVYDDEGNVSLTPSKINVSYKENLVRIFRRRRRVRRSLASFFNLSSPSESWLNSSVFSTLDPPAAESSWLEGNSDLDNGCGFFCENSSAHSQSHTPWFPTAQTSEYESEACYSKEQFSHLTKSLLDLQPPSQLLSQPSYSATSPKHIDFAFIRIFYFIVLAICICIAVLSRLNSGAMIVVLLTFVLLFLSFLLTKSDIFTFAGAQNKNKE